MKAQGAPPAQESHGHQLLRMGRPGNFSEGTRDGVGGEGSGRGPGSGHAWVWVPVQARSRARARWGSWEAERFAAHTHDRREAGGHMAH